MTPLNKKYKRAVTKPWKAEKSAFHGFVLLCGIPCICAFKSFFEKSLDFNLRAKVYTAFRRFEEVV